MARRWLSNSTKPTLLICLALPRNQCRKPAAVHPRTIRRLPVRSMYLKKRYKIFFRSNPALTCAQPSRGPRIRPGFAACGLRPTPGLVAVIAIWPLWAISVPFSCSIRTRRESTRESREELTSGVLVPPAPSAVCPLAMVDGRVVLVRGPLLACWFAECAPRFGALSGRLDAGLEVARAGVCLRA